MQQVGTGIESVPKEVWPVVSGVGVVFHLVREGVERGGRKTFFIDVGQWTHHSAVSGAQQVQVVGVAAVLGQ